MYFIKIAFAFSIAFVLGNSASAQVEGRRIKLPAGFQLRDLDLNPVGTLGSSGTVSLGKPLVTTKGLCFATVIGGNSYCVSESALVHSGVVSDEYCESLRGSGAGRLPKSLRSLMGLSNGMSEQSTGGLLIEDFPNPNGCFSENVNGANACSHPSYRDLNLVQKAQYIKSKYEALNRVHGWSFNPNVLTCKAMRESGLNAQRKNPSSSAVGLSQVLIGTAKDTFSRGGFRSRVAGFEHITDGAQFSNQMKTSMLAQLELGAAVYLQKSRDTGSTDDRRILAAYYGGSAQASQHYANKVLSCANCIETQGLSPQCLSKAN